MRVHVGRCSAAGGSHHTSWRCRSADADSESIWSAATAAAANAAAADVVGTPDADAVTTHAIRSPAGRAWCQRDAVGRRHSATDSPLSRDDTASCDYTARPCATFATGY